MAKPSVHALIMSIASSSDAFMNSSDTLAPYSTLIGAITNGAIVTPPWLFAPFSATISISLSILNMNSFDPLNGIGSCPDSLASVERPFTLLNISVLSFASNRSPFDNTAIIHFLLLIF